MSENIRVRIDGTVWHPESDETAEYDAIHAVAGAVLAGADEVIVERRKEGARWNDAE